MAFSSFVFFAVALVVATISAAPGGNKLSITIPDECKDKTGFCSIRPEGYDEIEEKINSLLPPYLINLGDRSGPVIPTVTESDEDNCPSQTTTQKVFTHNNETKVDIIVNTKLFPQSLETITCVRNDLERLKEDGKQCFRQLGLSNMNLKFSCQESTATRTLLVYDPEVELLKRKNYTIPVCCSCHITNE